MRRLCLVLALAACEQHPTKLDYLERMVPPVDPAWATSAERAQPVGVGLEHWRVAVEPDPSKRASLERRREALLTWFDMRGRLPDDTGDINDVGDAYDGVLLLGRDLMAAYPSDDRVCEALLYAASRMRREGYGAFATMVGLGVTRQVIERRPTPPAYARDYAPTDAEVFRMFATEAVWLRRREAQWSGTDIAAELAVHRAMADAPQERAALWPFLDRVERAHPRSRLPAVLRMNAKRMFDDVDAYQAWLAKR